VRRLRYLYAKLPSGKLIAILIDRNRAKIKPYGERSKGYEKQANDFRPWLPRTQTHVEA
jgi:hypothetical protein